jgi:hypothetical protein
MVTRRTQPNWASIACKRASGRQFNPDRRLNPTRGIRAGRAFRGPNVSEFPCRAILPHFPRWPACRRQARVVGGIERSSSRRPRCSTKPDGRSDLRPIGARWVTLRSVDVPSTDKNSAAFERSTRNRGMGQLGHADSRAPMVPADGRVVVVGGANRLSHEGGISTVEAPILPTPATRLRILLRCRPLRRRQRPTCGMLTLREYRCRAAWRA